MTEINIVTLNQEKPDTCGSCSHTDNDLGIVSLKCQIIHDNWMNNEYSGEDCDWAKVRSWSKCHFNPSRYTPVTNRSQVESELRKGATLYQIMDSINYPKELRNEAKKMLKETIQNLRATKEASK